MALSFIKEIGGRSGVFDRRFLIGLFFPVLAGLITAYTVFTKELPYDLLVWTYLIAITFTVSVVFIELAPRLCWMLSRTGKKYKKDLNVNYEEMFVKPVEKKIDGFGIDRKKYEKQFKGKFAEFSDNARRDYLSSFFLPEQRYSHEKLYLSETRFIFCFTVAFMALVNLLMTLICSLTEINFWIIQRDRIESLSTTIGSLFFAVAVIFSMMVWYQSQFFWEMVITSTNAPFKPRERELHLREGKIETLSQFVSGKMFASNELNENQLIKESAKPLIDPIIREEFKFKNREVLIAQILNRFLDKNSEYLGIDSKQATELSRDISIASQFVKAASYEKEPELKRIELYKGISVTIDKKRDETSRYSRLGRFISYLLAIASVILALTSITVVILPSMPPSYVNTALDIVRLSTIAIISALLAQGIKMLAREVYGKYRFIRENWYNIMHFQWTDIIRSS
ncbi:MAG: hypothetical protein ACFFD4_40305 [Candidatus Odinarchaeota archaeon]